MKDEHDQYTSDLVRPSKVKPFNRFMSTADDETTWSERPKEVFNKATSAIGFVPVSFVAKDWNVTPRRIRALLSDGRLEGRQQENGYWEVAHPYRFIFGTRGPSLKRQQRPMKSPRKVVNIREGKRV